MNLLCRLVLLALFAAQSTPEQTAAPGEATPVAVEASNTSIDVEDCKGCHDAAIFSQFERTTHAKLNQSCAQCHGSVEQLIEHATAGGDPSLVRSMKGLPAKETNKTCLTCHDRKSQASWHGGVHERRGLACTSCHSVHQFKSATRQLKTARESETCFSCHPSIRAQGLRASHHPVREGKMGCASCHNPHGSETPKMIKAESVNEQCYECHTEKRGPFLWEHAPVRESCLNCHNAHGSNHEKLLVAKQPYLCQRCHLNTRHPGTLYDLRNTLAGNPSNRAVEHGCRNCHQNIHGSNHPSGPYLGR